MQKEQLRSSFDIDGLRVFLSFDDFMCRFEVHTRWVTLAKFPFIGKTSKAVAFRNASATFEVCCLAGATVEVARNAKMVAERQPSINLFASPAETNFERQVIRLCVFA